MNKKYLIKSTKNIEYYKLDIKTKKVISLIFKVVKENDFFIIKKVNKTCFKIIKNNIEERKIKIIKNQIVYEETINNFIKILKKLNINSSIINDFLFFHWADLSLNNTGTKRYPFKEFIVNYNDKLVRINTTFNQKQIINYFFDLIFPLNYYYFLVNEDDYLLINKQNINIYLKNISKFMIHIGPFVYQNKCRNLNKNMKNEGKRRKIVLKILDYNNEFDIIK